MHRGKTRGPPFSIHIESPRKGGNIKPDVLGLEYVALLMNAPTGSLWCYGMVGIRQQQAYSHSPLSQGVRDPRGYGQTARSPN